MPCSQTYIREKTFPLCIVLYMEAFSLNSNSFPTRELLKARNVSMSSPKLIRNNSSFSPTGVWKCFQYDERHRINPFKNFTNGLGKPVYNCSNKYLNNNFTIRQTSRRNLISHLLQIGLLIRLPIPKLPTSGLGLTLNSIMSCNLSMLPLLIEHVD